MQESFKEIELDFKSIDLYNIVLDIEKYPDYIPWCSNIQIMSKEKDQIIADMIVNYKFFPSQKFTSKIFYNLENKLIKTKYIEGPLKDLDTIWKFEDLKKNKSKISFSVKFEFKNYFHQKFAEIFFPLVENKMMQSFIDRAEKIL